MTSVSNHLTAKLVLDLMSVAGDTPSSNSDNNCADMRKRAQNLRYAVMVEAASSSCESDSSSCSERFMADGSSSTVNNDDSSMSMTNSSADDEYVSEGRSRSDCEEFALDGGGLSGGNNEEEVDRSRAGAAAELMMHQDSLASLRSARAAMAIGERSWAGADDRRSSSEWDSRGSMSSHHPTRNMQSPLDVMDHPDLTGTLAALHGYIASRGDPSMLEKAYDMARGVAGSKHDMKVAFSACRIALAAGYVHSLQKSAPEMAHEFALHHSLPRLAQSLKSYWCPRTQWASSAEEREWEECMASLLEVTSSIYLMTGESDIVSVLDTTVDVSVAESIGDYCVRNPGVLFEYPHVGHTCARRHARARDSAQRSRLQRAISIHSE